MPIPCFEDDWFDIDYIKELYGYRTSFKAISRENGYYTSYNGNRVPVTTKKGLEVQMLCDDGTKTWVTLSRQKQPTSHVSRIFKGHGDTHRTYLQMMGFQNLAPE